MRDAEEIARRFTDAINDRDLDRMRQLLHPHHRLIDSLGRSIEGREAVLEAWRGYFGFMPEYRIEVGDVLVQDPRVAMFGSARGTFSEGGALLAENRWEIPAAWLARIDGSLVESWHVYADNKPVYEIMERYSKRRTDA